MPYVLFCAIYDLTVEHNW